MVIKEKEVRCYLHIAGDGYYVVFHHIPTNQTIHEEGPYRTEDAAVKDCKAHGVTMAHLGEMCKIKYSRDAFVWMRDLYRASGKA